MATLSRRLRMFRSAPETIRAACEGMDQTRTLWPFNFGSQNVSGRGPHQIIAIECNWRLFFVHVESIATGRSLVRLSPYKVKAKPVTDRFEYVRVMSGYAKQSLWCSFLPPEDSHPSQNPIGRPPMAMWWPAVRGLTGHPGHPGHP